MSQEIQSSEHLSKLDRDLLLKCTNFNPQEIYFLWEEFLKASKGEAYMTMHVFRWYLGRFGFKEKNWLFSHLDTSHCERVYFKDWICVSDKVCRCSVAECVSCICRMLCEGLDGGFIEENAKEICNRLMEINIDVGGNLTQEVLVHEVQHLLDLRKKGGEEGILLEASGCKIVQCCLVFLTKVFSPFVVDMENKLKRSVTMSLNVVCISRGEEIPKAIVLLCEQLLKVRQQDEKCAVFAPETMHKHREFVEAICNAFLNGWAPMDGVPVPVLLMVLRTYLRNFSEPLFTLHLSKELISSCATVKDNELCLDRLRTAYLLLPKFYQQSAKMLISTSRKLVCNEESLDAIARVLGYCLLRTESKSSGTSMTAIELAKILILNGDQFK